MKRILILLLVMSLLLCGCGKTETPDGSTATNDTQTTEQENTSESTEETTEETQEITEAPVLYRHPLTGQPLDEPWSGQMVAVMVNNIRDSMPQHGLSDADIVYEIQEEGDVTRNMAIYSDVSKVLSIGSIRSARTYFVSVAVAYDAYLVHCGTSKYAENGKWDYNGNRVANWKDIDQFYNASYFFRDTSRYRDGYAWEHTLFTNGELLAKKLEGKEQSKLYENGFGLQFDNDIDLQGETANEVTVKFKGGKTTTFVYDAVAKTYKRAQYGKDCIDGNTGLPTTYKNVIAIYTNQWGVSSGHQFYDTVGSGEGYAAINGTIVPIKWSREGLRSAYVYTLADGTPLTLDVGTTYIAVIGIRHPISYK